MVPASITFIRKEEALYIILLTEGAICRKVKLNLLENILTNGLPSRLQKLRFPGKNGVFVKRKTMMALSLHLLGLNG
jgi:hypothetical protein